MSDFALQRLNTLSYTCSSKRPLRPGWRSQQTTSAAKPSRFPRKFPECHVLLCRPHKEFHKELRDRQHVHAGPASVISRARPAILLKALTRLLMGLLMGLLMRLLR